MDLPSDSDESDVDFVPDVRGESSEDDGDLEETQETEGDDEPRKKGKKRAPKKVQNNSRSKRSKLNKVDNDSHKEDDCDTKDIDPVVDKKKDDDLWASFLSSPSESKSSAAIDEKTKIIPPEKEPSKITEKVKSPATVPGKRPLVGSSKAGGLSSVLNKIGKNNKLSTLEKSKLDWSSFKKDEGIEEEISIYNRGREGYLERQDFLQRTDLRQFEIEKNIRATKRSGR